MITQGNSKEEQGGGGGDVIQKWINRGIKKN